MKDIVIDANIAIKWFLPEPKSELAHIVLEKKPDMYVPAYFFIETESILTQKVRKEELSPEEARQILSALRSFPFQTIQLNVIRDNAFELASKLFFSYYDALYLTTAMLLKSRVFTADERFVRTASQANLSTFMLPVDYIV